MLRQKDAEIGHSNTLARNDRIFGLMASVEQASNKNENNEVSLISNSSSTSNNNVDKVMRKLPKLIIKEFAGNVLNWLIFWISLSPQLILKQTLVILINVVI